MFPLKLKRGAAGRAQHALDSCSSDCSQPNSPRSQQSAEPAPAEQGQGANINSSRFLVISVLEARNLVAKDYETHSSDPFVRITLGALSKKTRAIYRNCHPLWEQKLVFPIAGLDPAVPLQVELFDKDFNSKEFLGQVMMTLGKALDIASDETQRGCYWLVLSKQRSTDIVGGELCLGFEVTSMEQTQYNQMTSELDAQLSSDALASAYSSKALHIQLKGLNGLAASGLFGGSRDQTDHQHQHQHQQLSLFIKYGRVMLEKPLPRPVLPSNLTEDEPGLSCSQEHEVCVNEEVIIPLAAAVRATPLVARKKDELYDIKLYIKSHDTLIAKTQIPITAVPILSNSGSSGSSSATPEPDSLSSRSATLVDATHKELPVGEAAGSLCLAANSMPSTPRGTTVDFPSSCSPATPTTTNMAASLCDTIPASPRACQGALSTLNKRLGVLGGWAGSSSNLAAISRCDSSPSTLTAGLASNSTLQPSRSPSPFRGAAAAAVASKFGVEGSLDSVTAYSRDHPVHAPAGLHGRKVQGLAEMREGSVTAPLNGLRRPLKAIFVPPREADRSGWVPIKPQEEGAEEPLSSPTNSRCRSFTRIMESTVPMYCNLEVSLGLAVVEQKAASLLAGATAAVNIADLSDDSLWDDDDEQEVQAAVPITLPPPLEVLLQDATLQGVGVNRLFALTISADSDLMKAHHAAHEITEMSVGPWRAMPLGTDYQRVRSVAYTKRLNIPLPLAPEKCHVWEEHRLVAKEAGGWRVDITCRNNAPKGDCFEAHVQMCGVYVDSNTSRLRVSMQLNWTKNTWGKGMVQGGAETDAKRSYAALVQRLREQACISSAGAGLQVAVQPSEQASLIDAGPKLLWGRCLCRSNVELSVRALMVLALLTVAYSVLTVGRNISAELQDMIAAIQQCSVAGSTAAVTGDL